MLRAVLIVAVLFTFPAVGLTQTTWYVPNDFPAGIQAAIVASADGDAIIVQPGTYVENIVLLGKAITIKSKQGPSSTVIDGNQAGSVVSFINNETTDTILDGFTITNGSGTYESTRWMGGGIYCRAASPCIINNYINSNYAEDSGGGIKCGPDSNPVIQWNLISNSSTKHGGGIHIGFSNPTLSNNIINNNYAGWGGAIFLHTSSIYVTNNMINNNETYYSGGGIYIHKSSPYLINNTIYGNYADPWYGGGIYCTGGNLTIINTILWDNYSIGGGNEIYLSAYAGTAHLSISYSNVESGVGSVQTESGCSTNWGDGMIEEDPAFVNRTISDFHLLYSSPCKDTGDNTVIMGLNDFEGNPRIAYGTVDMGADEFHPHFYYTGDTSPGGSVEGKIIGQPATDPVILFFGSGIQETPLNIMYGDWHLELPMVYIEGIGPVSPEGLITIPATIPDPAAPVYYLQAFIGDVLSNPMVMEVK